ncbi:hypothetical protein [Phenylobacterium ferrooxidans]|uniref:Uncharacterized protein n=1 Tax=Phenylobacterium ferrooxidans TaxID=2982689 RepID=A0ABW6CJA4_9CAUL
MPQSAPSQAEDLYPETLPTEVEITNSRHLMQIGEWSGIAKCVAALKDVPDNRRTPGFSYALALLEAQEAESRAGMMHRNLAAASKAGVEIHTMRALGFDGSKLVCTPFAPGEEA